MLGRSAVAAALLCLSGCGVAGSSASRSGSEVSSLPIQLFSAPDEELFRNNANVDRALQLELKRQMLGALAWSGLLRESRAGNPDIRLEEISITKARESSLTVDVDARGGMQTRENAAENRPGLGAQVTTHYYLKNSTYSVAFTFVDRFNQVHRLALGEPLTVEEKLQVQSRVKLDVGALKALPSVISKVVARFFDDIGVAVDAGVAWERTSGLSVRMFHRASPDAPTELVRDLVADVAIPLCSAMSSNMGIARETCNVALPPVADPLIALEGRLNPSPRWVTRCEKTSRFEFAQPVYLMATEVDVPNVLWNEGKQVYLYKQVDDGLKRVGSATVLGNDQSGRCGAVPAGKACLTVKFLAHWFDGECENYGLLALSERDAPFFYR